MASYHYDDTATKLITLVENGDDPTAAGNGYQQDHSLSMSSTTGVSSSSSIPSKMKAYVQQKKDAAAKENNTKKRRYNPNICSRYRALV